MSKSQERERAASPGPIYMSNQQMSSYLKDLRQNRPTRPTGSRPVGSRPPPAHFSTWSSRSAVKFADSAIQSTVTEVAPEAGSDADAPPERKTHRRTTSNMSIDEILAGYGGRALVQPPRGRDSSRTSTSRERTPSVQYREDGRRQVEREEARDLRLALEELDVQSEEKVYTSARDEAAELVWKHQNPNAPENQPDAPYSYPGLKGKGHQRSRSLGRGEQDVQDLQRANSKLRKRTSLGSSASQSRSSSLHSHRSTSESSVAANAGFSTSPTKPTFKEGEGAEQSEALPKAATSTTAQRRRSSGGKRKTSGSLFKNPQDQIYEEPEEDAPAAAATVPAASNPQAPPKLPLQMRRNPFSRVQFARNNSLVRSQTDPTVGTKRFDRYEIQRNPPSQSRNAAYTSNPKVDEPKAEEPIKADAENEPEIKMKDGKEVRSDDIRAATGFRLKDRSQKLPTPTMVSDSPGRPIVSFKSDWRPKEVELKQEISVLPNATPKTAAVPRPLSKAATAPVVPTINTPAAGPSIEAGKPSAPQTQAPANPPSATPSGRSSPFKRTSRAMAPVISIFEDPPSSARPNANTRKVHTPPQNATPPLPTFNVSQAPAARPRPGQAPVIPAISVQDAPPVAVDRAVKPPSVSVTPSVPTISVGPPSISVSPSVPSINVSPSVPSINVSPSVPSINVSPSVPSINVSPSAPSINVTPSIPSINVGPAASTRPLPDPKNHAGRSFARHNASNSRSHWTPTTVRTGALCTQCALPISGRIVSAAGHRFHPECFLCHHCGEHLECVAFYPEPENKRQERLARIDARQNGEDIEFLPSHPTHEDMLRLEQEDGDRGARFFCHLDFHELFSPRCKSCKTPIEGEVVVACGAEWHVGHFFCAQCGDPFNSATPFVEKDGFAWCVGCHTNRFSAKCRKCRKPVTDTVVKALGKEWHQDCFCCVECSGPFEDGRYFLRGDSEDPVCVRCEERRLKA